MGANPPPVRRTSHAAPSVRRREPNSLVAAVRDELSRRRSTAVVTASTPGAGEAVVVRDARGPEPAGPVLVAIDDDANAATLTAYGLAEASRRGVTLRTVYVWTDCRPPYCDHHRACHGDLGEAAQLLADIVEENLSVDELADVERDVLHDSDPGGALSALSSSASLLVVGASSRRDAHELLGETTRRMLGRTRCPLAVVPTAPPGFPHGLRRPAHSSGTLAPDRRSRSGRV